ncbi:hypothetical protein MDA_GLEAN10009264 [Myotis davidii]|uniref:Uncharacterized protein n=1 Tax=Myotis davidii TaxID=225400 RepID=L5LC46_MYODS|nr:hypothetical protein MDA_GLEAN10009264 [Myotis davidii]
MSELVMTTAGPIECSVSLTAKNGNFLVSCPFRECVFCQQLRAQIWALIKTLKCGLRKHRTEETRALVRLRYSAGHRTQWTQENEDITSEFLIQQNKETLA